MVERRRATKLHCQVFEQPPTTRANRAVRYAAGGGTGSGARGNSPGLHVRHRGTLSLLEMHFGPQQQRAEKQIGQRQHDVIIFLHVTVVQQMMAVEAKEYSGTLDITFARQMHAPVYVFVSAVITGTGSRSADDEGPMASEPRGDKKRQHADYYEHWAVPPGHWDGVFILFAYEMVAGISLENAMMDERMPLVRIGKLSKRPVHDITVQEPFEKGGIDGGEEKPASGPKAYFLHWQICLISSLGSGAGSARGH
jgi:hypothetical protein